MFADRYLVTWIKCPNHILKAAFLHCKKQHHKYTVMAFVISTADSFSHTECLWKSLENISPLVCGVTCRAAFFSFDWTDWALVEGAVFGLPHVAK